MKASYFKYVLDFKRPSGTSRGILKQKETWFIVLESNGKKGIGECGILRSLSVEDTPFYQDKLKWACDNIHLGLDQLWQELIQYPSIQFGLEQAFLSLQSNDPFILWDNAFSNAKDSIAINGLVWMGDPLFMKQQIDQKIQEGFNCVKLKIGAIDFDKELELLAYIRSLYSKEQIELRVDANGGFTYQTALDKLKALSVYDIQSIEQPIATRQWEQMRDLVEKTPIPIALDEELIGVFTLEEKAELLDRINPQYIILKPSLIGGFKGSMQWIELAKQRNIGYWITSALESNIGLNAIAQWTYTLDIPIAQGLGTGGLYTNNISSGLKVENGALWYDPKVKWQCQWIE
ncbi:o-succinylbenzoate synthase [Myroides sp. LJL116]